MSDESKDTPEAQILGDLLAVWGICRRRLGITTIVIAALVVPNIGGAASGWFSSKANGAPITKEQADTIIKELSSLTTGQSEISSNFKNHKKMAAYKFEDLKSDLADIKQDLRDRN